MGHGCELGFTDSTLQFDYLFVMAILRINAVQPKTITRRYSMEISKGSAIQVGPVQVEFKGSASGIRRTGSTIFLPAGPDFDGFHLLAGGTQFVAHYRVRPAWDRAQTYFGGMDESPFLTALTEVPYKALLDGGEKAFFDSLKPDAIKTLQATYPASCVQRQGDIWSINIPHNWEHICNQMFPNYKSLRKRRRQLLRDSSSQVDVLDTNHRIQGRYYFRGRTEFIRVGETRLQGIALGEGILTAPDHAPAILTNEPHVIAQTPHILPQSRWAGFD